MRDRKAYLNQLEPEEIIRVFQSAPPDGFVPQNILVREGEIPGFVAEFDLITTADEKVKRTVQVFKKYVPFFDRINLRPKTLFVGTTVSEYALFPSDIHASALKGTLVSRMIEEGCSLVIVKDIPADSPLLSGDENETSKLLMSSLREGGFILLSGQALAYVPIKFSSTEEYLQRFSRVRRKDMKRKLRSFADISVEELKTGDDFFNDVNIESLYRLFLNTYDNSSVHFDRLTYAFFGEIFRDRNNGGIVFLYRNWDGLLAFNLCFIFNGRLVDKYIGFRYPEARKHNLYFLSWFHNLDFCLRNNLDMFIAGWTDPEIKSHLGAEFTSTCHAVYVKNPLLRFCFERLRGFFESDKHILEGLESGKI